MAEDQLTEALAHVLDADTEFHNRLISFISVDADGSIPAHPGIVSTQVATASGRRPDLEIRFEAPRFCIWIEVKDKAQEGYRQLADYEVDLQQHWGEDHLLVLLAPNPENVARDSPAKRLSWQEVADIAESVGRNRGGVAWRDAAVTADAPVRQQTLADFLFYLEWRHVAADNQPITRDEERLAGQAGRLIERLNRLLERAVDKSELEHGPTHGSGPVWLWRTLRRPGVNGYEVTLNGDSSGYRALSFQPLDDDGRAGEPLLTAGVWFDASSPEVVAALSDPEWLATIPAEIQVDTSRPRSTSSVLITRSLGHFVGATRTFDEQAADLGCWTSESLRLVEQHLPR